MLQPILPISLKPYSLKNKKPGLVLVDIINGFATVGAGSLAPQAPNAQIDQMVKEANHWAHYFVDHKKPLLAFLDTHISGKAEQPYPPHCEEGTGEENLVPDLEWLENVSEVTLIRKDCINGVVGAIDRETKENRFVSWVHQHQLESVIVMGICTDICVMDFVLTLLSVRNHGLVPTLQDIVVYEPGCATYDLPQEALKKHSLPDTATHPQAECHHIGLYCMAARGAILANQLLID